MLSRRSLGAVIEEGRIPGGKLFPRPFYLQQFAPFIPRKEVLVLTGVRRSGKSTLMRLLMRELLDSGVASIESAGYVNLEDYRLSESLTPDLLGQILTQFKRPGRRAFLFMDEIQAIPGWEKWARTVHDSMGDRVKIIVSGSNASLLGKDYSTLLTGRNITFRIAPLSYLEYLNFGKTAKPTLSDYLEFGGFPEVVLAEEHDIKRRLLRQYFEDIVNKDVINRHSIRNTRQVHTLARFLAANPGQKTSFNKLAKTFGFKSTDTVIRYAQYLKDTFLVHEVPFHSYSIQVRHDPSRLPKYYVCDNGFIGILEDPISKDHGRRMENAAYLSIRPRGEITYWSDGKQEVDFITGQVAINVTTSTKPLEREVRGLVELARVDRQIRRKLLVTPQPVPQSGIEMVEPERFLTDSDKMIPDVS